MKRFLLFFPVMVVLNSADTFAVYIKVGAINVGAWAGHVEIRNNLLYTTNSSNLFLIYSISDPLNTVLTGSCQLPTWGGKVVLADTLAYINGYSKIHILNIKTPSNPLYLGSFDVTMAQDFIVSDTLAYISGYYDFQIVNVSNPLSPQFLGTAFGKLTGMCKKDTLIYGVRPSLPQNLIIINVKDPNHPVESDYLNLSIGSSAGIDISDTIVFIAYSKFVFSIDVNDPLNPQILDTISCAGYSTNIWISGGSAFINNQNSGFNVINVSDPGHMNLTGYYDTPGMAYEVKINDNYAYVSDGYSEIQIVDISDPFDPMLIGYFQTYGQANDIAFKDNYAYIGVDGGMDVVNIADPYHPAFTWYIHCMGWAGHISALNNHLCLTSGYDWPHAYFIDITDPANPVCMDTLELQGMGMYSPSIVQFDSTIFISIDEKLNIYNTSDFANPVLISTYTSSAWITDFVISGNKAYLALADSGIQVVDVSNPVLPVMISAFQTPGGAYQLLIRNDTLLVSEDDSGLIIYDVSNPMGPVLVTALKPHSSSRIGSKPLLDGNFMYLFDASWNEIFKYDAANLASPLLISSGRQNNEINVMSKRNGLFYCLDNYYGLSIFDFTTLSVDDRPAGAKNSVIWNYPNPFSAQTHICYTIPSEAYVSISVLNSQGETVKSLFSARTGKGQHSMTWDGKYGNGITAPNGLYFIHMICGDKSYSAKVLKN
jgi:hypothetical protein